MKPPTEGPLAAPLLLLLLISTVSLSICLAAPVLDTDGDALKPSLKYYIIPAVSDVAGGTALRGRNRTCPLSVVLASSPANKGLAAKFLPADAGDNEIETAKDVSVSFPRAITICLQSTVWHIQFDEVDQRYYVETGSPLEKLGSETLDEWFKIYEFDEVKEREGAYKIVFCPTACETCRPVCGPIGVYNEAGRLWLGISDVPFPFVFEKA